MAGGIETFVIHLARATGRRAQVAALIDQAPWRASLLDAVDGGTLAPDDRPVVRNLLLPKYPFPLSPGEVGCFLSHRAAWQRIVDGGLDAALILEDDVALEDGFADAAQFAARHIAELGYIQFQVRPVNGAAVDVASDGRHALIRPQITPLRTSAQLVGRSTAQRLLEMTTRIDRPVDTFLQMHWETGVRVCCLVPSCVTDRTAETGGSTISRRRGLWDKLRREFLRNRYRAQVKRLSR